MPCGQILCNDFWSRKKCERSTSHCRHMQHLADMANCVWTLAVLMQEPPAGGEIQQRRAAQNGQRATPDTSFTEEWTAVHIRHLIVPSRPHPTQPVSKNSILGCVILCA